MSKSAMDSMQFLPSAGIERELLREKGQFWTPPWLAKAMASWVTAPQPNLLFDPAVGPGTFFAAARAVGFKGAFAGFELHEAAFKDGEKIGLERSEFDFVSLGDFISSQVARSFPAIISNPPYIRHHRLDEAKKAQLRLLAEKVLGFALDGRVGLHLFFLLKCLEHLSPSGRLAFLLPADVCEGVSSKAVWNRLCERYCLEAVLTFEESCSYRVLFAYAIVGGVTKRASSSCVVGSLLSGSLPSTLTVTFEHRPMAILGFIFFPSTFTLSFWSNSTSTRLVNRIAVVSAMTRYPIRCSTFLKPHPGVSSSALYRAITVPNGSVVARS